MTQHLKQKLAAIMTGCAILLSIGNLIIVNALQPQDINTAIVNLICGIIAAAAVYFCGFKRLLKVIPYLLVLELLLLLICSVFALSMGQAAGCRWAISDLLRQCWQCRCSVCSGHISRIRLPTRFPVKTGSPLLPLLC